MSFVILRQGVELFGGAFAELTDAGISKGSREKLVRALDPLLHRDAADGDDATDVSKGPRVLAVRELRAKRAGSLINVDVAIEVPHTTTVLATSELEEEITRLLKDVRREVSEVRVRFYPIEDGL